MERVALVTGSSRGIGRAIASELARTGYSVCINYIRHREAAESLASELAAAGCRTITVQADVADSESVAEMVRRTERELGHISLLVNNAGISYIGLLQDMTPEEWNRVLATNLTGCFLTCRQAIPLMVRAKRGRILNISSVWGAAGASMEAAYSASKGAVNSLTKALAKELAPSNIQVNALACGVIDTDMNRCFSEEERRALMEEIPAGRFGTPEEAAVLACQILEAPEYMTGQIITMDGGWI